MDLRPSSSHIWTKCAAMPLMSSRVPPGDVGDPAREGTCAAWVAEMVLTGAVSTAADMVGQSHENGWLVEPDMAQHIQKYVDRVRSYGGEIHTERKVRLNQHIAGTPDAFAVLGSDHVLIVDDLKYGFGLVEPYQNPQVCIYAGAILRMLTARGVRVDRVVIGIYQPRAWSPAGIHRIWSCYPEELMSFVQTIEEAGNAAQNPNAPATPGAHCEYCDAAATCAANAAENYRVYERNASQQQRHMTVEELAKELDFLEMASDMLKGRKSAVEAEAAARMKRAETIPGWHMEQRAGQRRFTVPAATVRALTGLDPEVPKMVTPAELERMGASDAVVARITETPRTAPRLKKVAPGYYANLFKQR